MIVVTKSNLVECFLTCSWLVLCDFPTLYKDSKNFGKGMILIVLSISLSSINLFFYHIQWSYHVLVL